MTARAGEIDFKNTVILMTSNLGANELTQLLKPQEPEEAEEAAAEENQEANGQEQIADTEVELSAQMPETSPEHTKVSDGPAEAEEAPEYSLEELAEAIRPILTDHFQAALLARMQVVPYRPLEKEALAQIVRLKLDKIADRLYEAHQTRLSYSEDFAATYAELRAHKGMTIEAARERMSDPSYFGTMLVYKGIADGMVSGAINTTANTIRPSLEFIKTRPGTKIVSSVFLMLMEDRVLVYGDCAVNPNPNAEQLADIAKLPPRLRAEFGVGSEGGLCCRTRSRSTSGSGADVDVVREATEIVRASNPDFAVEGPIQYDAASNMSIASTKMPDSQVAGQATVFIFPDLNTGNNTYKAVQQSSGAPAVGPVLQGLRKPVNDLSRGTTVEDIINTVAITAIQAQGM